ncbi:hypothetical protein M427DRAFT_50222 [Gonapodya prolifera JEL478]|uniref:Uncharacterized protein n=1 Tax=Gonapodya prolifera (strain JEL478) TaxID=1344416 RepID=A0A138ZWM1_GONPJ|nr:hypothetical protein M427DRAFT_50222 [Gonapodya prolifera JEL478]|eukprot:KXS08896.1 hypothetical protein M427DRAFT_50222 [Gonapodya prolifera JEL478]
MNLIFITICIAILFVVGIIIYKFFFAPPQKTFSTSKNSVDIDEPLQVYSEKDGAMGTYWGPSKDDSTGVSKIKLDGATEVKKTLNQLIQESGGFDDLDDEDFDVDDGVEADTLKPDVHPVTNTLNPNMISDTIVVLNNSDFDPFIIPSTEYDSTPKANIHEIEDDP